MTDEMHRFKGPEKGGGGGKNVAPQPPHRVTHHGTKCPLQNFGGYTRRHIAEHSQTAGKKKK